jgi:hypothetical protein
MSKLYPYCIIGRAYLVGLHAEAVWKPVCRIPLAASLSRFGVAILSLDQAPSPGPGALTSEPKDPMSEKPRSSAIISLSARPYMVLTIKKFGLDISLSFNEWWMKLTTEIGLAFGLAIKIN